MSKEFKHINNYTAQDIRRYWENKMSPAEMNAIEKAALDDPFLADAMEGYSGLKGDSDKHIAELQGRLANRVGERAIDSRRNYTFLRVAAAIILLVGFATLAFKLLNPNTETTQSLARQEALDNKNKNEAATTQPPIETKSDSVSIDYKNANPVVESNKSGDGKASLSQTKKEEEKLNFATADSTKLGTRERDLVINQDKPSPTLKTASPASVSKDQDQRGDVQSIAEKEISQDQMRRAVTFNNYSGRVIDPQRNAISNATIRLNNANQVSASDQNGYFQFRSVDTSAHVSIEYNGYQDRSLVLQRNQTPSEIVLDPLQNKKFSESVSSKSGKRKEGKQDDTYLKVYVMDAQPAIGWSEFNEYIEKNKRVDPSDTLKNDEVVVSFTVDSKGQLSSFLIEKSLGKWYDAEAIRLVKQGPKWRVLKGKKPRVKVIIGF